MSQKSDGMNYAPQGKPQPVCKPGDFPFAAVSLDHGHIYGQCNGLQEAGGDLRYVYDPDPQKVAKFCQTYPHVKPVDRLETILENPEIKLVAAAAIPHLRGPLGIRVMESGKDYFTDKTPFTSLSQLEQARLVTQKTKQKYMVYYSERLHVEVAMFAGELVHQDVIGKVVQVIGFGPHRLSAPSRPEWFFKKAQYGGILTDIGSHQIEQYLYYSGAQDATITHAAVANVNSPDYPELEDFGEASLLGDNGSRNYYRVDWLTPQGLSTWGDGRTVILGTKGYIEMRKYVDIARNKKGNHLYLVTDKEEQYINVEGQIGYPFFGKLILDCLNRTEKAMTQAHAFKAAELCLLCQQYAEK